MTREAEPSAGQWPRPDDLARMFGRCGLDPVLRCALAVSGGSDSTALMVLFAEWLRAQGLDATRHVVLTVDHGLRPESAAEARAVAERAASFGLRHVTLTWDGAKPHTGIQAAARSARYELIAAYVLANGFHRLLVGHTRDDRAETLLMRLARGSGLDGLAGMAPRLRFTDLGLQTSASGDHATADDVASEIVRPLLDVSRAQLRTMLEARGIAWVDDPSNDKLAFERPRLRAARAHLDDLGLTDAMLALSATRLLRARRALDRVVAEFCAPAAGAVEVDPCGVITMSRAGLQASEDEIALRALGRAVAAAGGSDAPVPLAKLEAVAAALREPSHATVKWTLARAMITADERTITVEREPGRAPLPRLQLARGQQATWDGRFLVKAGADIGPAAVEVRPLGETAARDLRRQSAAATGVPLRVAAMVPSFWHGEALLAVPSLQFRAPHEGGVLEAAFLWNENVNRIGSDDEESP